MHFFILAGGCGKRAEPLSLIKPKPLFPLAGQPVIHILLAQLKQQGISRGFINLHHLPEQIRESVEKNKSNQLIDYFYEEQLSGSKILTKAAPYIEPDDFLLVVNGDMFLDIPLQPMQQKVTAAGWDGILLVTPSTRPGYPAILLEDGCYAGRNKEGESKSLMYTGVALLNRRVLEAVDEINFFDSLDKYQGQFRVGTLLYQGLWLDLGTPQLYAAAAAAYKNYLIKASPPGSMSNDQGSNSLSQNVGIRPGSIVEHSIIWENTIIAGSSHLSNCIVTGNLTLEHAHYSGKIITASGIYDLNP